MGKTAHRGHDMTATRVSPGVRRSRNAIDAEVQVSVGTRRLRAAILDVSLSGLRARHATRFDLVAGQLVELRFPLDADDPLVVRASVVRSGGEELAFRFEAPTGPHEDALRSLIQRRGQLRDEYGD